MRVISQDGLWDIPYERSLVYVSGSGQIIKVQPLGETDSDYTFAIYASKEKAMKAMTYMQCYFAIGKLYFQFPKDSEVEV